MLPAVLVYYGTYLAALDPTSVNLQVSVGGAGCREATSSEKTGLGYLLLMHYVGVVSVDAW